MTLQPCVDCGELSERNRCQTHRPAHAPKAPGKQRGYDWPWIQLSRRARRIQPFCSMCGSTEDLTTDHSEEAAQRSWTSHPPGGRRCPLPHPQLLEGSRQTHRGEGGRGPSQPSRQGKVWDSYPRGYPVKAGPKAPVTADPLCFKGWPRDRAKRRERFIREFVKVPKGVGAEKAFKLRPWQQDILRGAFAPGVRTALVSLPRANGKSALAAALAVAELWVGAPSAEVLVVASDERQARIVLRMAKRMIELNPELAERTQIYADRIYVPENDATMIALPADPGALHGWDPSLLVVDELHVISETVWEAVTSMAGKRPESLTLAISTPSTSPDCVMWRLIEHGRAGDDPAFFLKEFSAPEGCATDDREAWAAANPALNDFLAEDGLESARRTLREPVFRQLRLGQWVTGVEGWMPFGAWDACRSDRSPEPKQKVVLAFDGSASGDSTALVGWSVQTR